MGDIVPPQPSPLHRPPCLRNQPAGTAGISTHPKLLAVDLARQLVADTCEHALDHLLDYDVDLTHFDLRPARNT